ALGAALLALAGSLAAQERPQPSPTPAPGSASVVTSITVFAGTTEGLFRSRDWGNTWQSALGRGGQTYGLDQVGAVRDVVALGSQVFLGGNGGVYLSDDFGGTWRRTDTGAPVVRVLPSRYPLSDPTVFAATTKGLLKSQDGGRTFAPTPLGSLNVTRLE